MSLRTSILDPIAHRLGYVGKTDALSSDGRAHRYDQSTENTRRGTNKGPLQASFPALRQFAEECEPVRLAIQKRKAQLLSTPWDIVAKDEAKGSSSVEKDIATAKAFFSTRGGLGGPGRRMRGFLNAILEDLLTVGAFSCYRRPSRGGQLYSIEPIDAATIKPLLTPEGWTPEPPAFAYEQWIKNTLKDSFTADQLWYETWDVRTYSRWTRSPVEYILGSAIQFLAIETWNLSWFRDGDGEFTYWETPEEWTFQQVKEFNAFVQQMAEDMKARRKGGPGLAVPGGPKRQSARPRTEAEYSETGLQLWRRIACAFDLNATVLGFEGQQYKVSQEGQGDAAEQWGNKPLCLLLDDFFTDVIELDLGITTCEFKYKVDEKDLEKIARTARNAGPTNMSPNDARELMGLELAEGPYADCLFVPNASGPPTIIGWRKGADLSKLPGSVQDPAAAEEEAKAQAPEPGAARDGTAPAAAASSEGTSDTVPGGSRLADAARATAGKLADAIADCGELEAPALADLRRWQKKARGRALDGRSPAVSFTSSAIPEPVAKAIALELEDATSPDEVAKVFAPALERSDPVDVVKLSSDVHRLLEAVDEERGRRQGFPHR